MPSLGPYGTALLDDFNRANANPLDGNWNPDTNLDSFNTAAQLSSNQAGLQITSTAYLTSYGPRCEAFVTVATVPAAGRSRIAARLSTQDNLANGYAFDWNPGGVQFELVKFTAGVRSQLANFDTATLSNGDAMAVACLGSTIEGWRYTGGAWTKLLSFVDASFTAAGFLGFGLGQSTGVVDDFGGGTIVEQLPISTRPRFIYLRKNR